MTVWLGLLAAVTVVMAGLRPEVGSAHVALAYLAIVLGASAYAGRGFGLVVAALASLLLDWFFQLPYGTLAVDRPIDWLVLLAFFVAGGLAAELLYRAQERARAADARAIEAGRLAMLGAESLSAGRAGDALAVIVDVVRSTLEMEWSEIYVHHADSGAISLGAQADSSGHGRSTNREMSGDAKLVAWVAEHGSRAIELEDGTSIVGEGVDLVESASFPAAGSLLRRVFGRGGDEETTRGYSALYVPLYAHDRVVGVLGVGASRRVRLDGGGWRVLRALSYYAALGIERVRLIEDVERAEALSAADELKDAVLAAVSHDLRTPLTTIKALANQIAVGGDTRAETIEQEADRLNIFVENLLDLSRIQAGGAARNAVANDAEDLVGAALKRLSGQLTGRSIDVNIESAGDEPLIGRFDFTDTLHALVNLLENALKYAPSPDAVELNVRREGGLVVFVVADRGPGVQPEDRERIFEPFFRSGATPSGAQGAGLGLSIARGLASAQGGSVSYEARQGGGSLFKLSLPALEDPRLDLPPEE